MTTPSRRFLVFAGPGGVLTTVAADNAPLRSRYTDWQHLATVHRALTPARADAAKRWAVRSYTC